MSTTLGQYLLDIAELDTLCHLQPPSSIDYPCVDQPAVSQHLQVFVNMTDLHNHSMTLIIIEAIFKLTVISSLHRTHQLDIDRLDHHLNADINI